MAERLAKISELGEYQPYLINGAQSATIIDVTHTHGTFVGHVVIGTVGTTPVITLSNGASTPFAVITPTAVGALDFECVCDKGLYVTVTGSGMSVTIMAIGMAV